jgi:hypothetical protein
MHAGCCGRLPVIEKPDLQQRVSRLCLSFQLAVKNRLSHHCHTVAAAAAFLAVRKKRALLLFMDERRRTTAIMT